MVITCDNIIKTENCGIFGLFEFENKSKFVLIIKLLFLLFSKERVLVLWKRLDKFPIKSTQLKPMLKKKNISTKKILSVLSQLLSF